MKRGYKPTPLQQRLLKAVTEDARRRGEELETHIIPFTNNDVPRYLEGLKKFEDSARPRSITVTYREAA